MIVLLRHLKGGGWHEPPYTWEEEMDFYRRINAGPMNLSIEAKRTFACPTIKNAGPISHQFLRQIKARSRQLLMIWATAAGTQQHLCSKTRATPPIGRAKCRVGGVALDKPRGTDQPAPLRNVANPRSGRAAA
jgi:hypothetical protein